MRRADFGQIRIDLSEPFRRDVKLPEARWHLLVGILAGWKPAFEKAERATYV
jgi:hypothetical protein